jgi:hypothetical protein
MAITKVDFNGSPAKAPAGFDGFIETCIATAMAMFLYWGAGAFSCWF